MESIADNLPQSSSGHAENATASRVVPSKPVILVDKRQADWQENHLRGHGFDVRMVMLPAGDFAWSTPWGRVGIEDKPLSALVTDKRSGRLDDELRRLVAMYELPVLFIRGMPSVAADGSIRWLPQEAQYRDGWTIDALDNLLLGRQMKGVYVTWCPSDGYLGNRLLSLYKYTQRRPQDESLKPQRPQVMPWLGPLTGRAELLFTLLGQVRGVRDRRELAERLAANYTLGQVLNFTVDDWKREGMTKLMAGRIAEHMKAVIWEQS